MRQSPAVLAQPCDSAFNPMPFFFWFVFPISPSSTRGYCLSKDVHKCFRDLNEISCMWTFTGVHAVSVSRVQTVTHSRKHSIRLDEQTFKQVEPVTRREKKKDLCTSLAFWQLCKQFIFTNHVVICVCKWSKFLFVVRLRGSGWNVSLESINVESEIPFLFCAVWLRGASAKREDNTVCSS